MERFPIKRRLTRQIKVGDVTIGGDAPIRVQSMTDTDTEDVEATINQIVRLQEAGCELVRLAVPTMAAARAISKIKENIAIPLIADIHFNYRLALAALDNRADGLRINPGNIGSRKGVSAIIKAAKERGVSIRIGANVGSLPAEILNKYTHPTAPALVESILHYLDFFEEQQFDQIKLSLKASDVPTTVAAYRMIASQVDYPLHLGVTEAGPLLTGSIKSALALGILLTEGIGDTLRVSLSGDPVEEVRVAYAILKGLRIRFRGPDIISCPGCGRTKMDVAALAMEVEAGLAHITAPLKIALMGCVVNGPGEAREADLGIAGGKGRGVLFKRGELIKRGKIKELVKTLIQEAERLARATTDA